MLECSYESEEWVTASLLELLINSIQELLLSVLTHVEPGTEVIDDLLWDLSIENSKKLNVLSSIKLNLEHADGLLLLLDLISLRSLSLWLLVLDGVRLGGTLGIVLWFLFIDELRLLIGSTSLPIVSHLWLLVLLLLWSSSITWNTLISLIHLLVPLRFSGQLFLVLSRLTEGVLVSITSSWKLLAESFRNVLLLIDWSSWRLLRESLWVLVLGHRLSDNWSLIGILGLRLLSHWGLVGWSPVLLLLWWALWSVLRRWLLLLLRLIILLLLLLWHHVSNWLLLRLSGSVLLLLGLGLLHHLLIWLLNELLWWFHVSLLWSGLGDWLILRLFISLDRFGVSWLLFRLISGLLDWWMLFLVSLLPWLLLVSWLRESLLFTWWLLVLSLPSLSLSWWLLLNWLLLSR